MDNATGFAYKDNDTGIDINTVCSTERGAKVNALQNRFKTPVWQNGTDEMIKHLFANKAKGVGEIVEVKVTDAF